MKIFSAFLICLKKVFTLSFITSLIALSTSAIPATAAAEVERTEITCTFTKPFLLTTIYKTFDMSFTVYDPFTDDKNPPVTEFGLLIRDAGNRKSEIYKRDGTVVQKLEMTFKGSDGTSDVVYPFEVQWLTDRSPTHKMVGGCTMTSED